MVDAVKELGTPSLHALWLAAKKKSEEEARRVKQADKMALLEKKFKSDFGPHLDKWPRLYPDYKKLVAECHALLATDRSYKDAVNAAGLDDKIAKPMLAALDSIRTQLPERLKKAEVMIASDLELAIAESKKVQRTPIVVFRQDVAKQVMEAAGHTGAGLKAKRIDLEVVLTDTDLLEKVPNDLDDTVLAKDIRAAADFKKVIQELAAAFVTAAKSVREKPESLDSANGKFKQEVNKIIHAAAERAGKPIEDLAQVKASYSSYKIESGVQLALAVAGTLSSAASLCLAPLTLGLATVTGLLGVARGGMAIGATIAKLGMEAEEMANVVSADIATLNKRYKEVVSSGKVGRGELARTLVNETMPTLITTIKSAGENCEQLGKKIDGLEVSTHKQAELLGKMLTEQAKLQKVASDLKKLLDHLSPAEAAMANELIDGTKEVDKSVNGQMDKIETLHKRTVDTRKTHEKLAGELDRIASKEPTWAQVGEVLIKAGAAAGFIGAGHVGAPEPYQFAKQAAEINGHVGDTIATIDALRSSFDDLKELVGKHAKH